MLNSNERIPYGWSMIRCEHPEPIMYTFGLDIDPITWAATSSFLFFVTVEKFNNLHGHYEANRRHIIQRCTALDFVPQMTEPFRVVRDEIGNDNLIVNGHTLLEAMMFHSMRIGHPGGSFTASEFKLFLEKYTNAGNEALVWFDTITPRDRAVAFQKVLQRAIYWRKLID